MERRSASLIWLVGATNENFCTSKLPSRGDVLKVLFHYHNDKKMGLKESINECVSLLLPIWEMARIPTKFIKDVKENIRKLHVKWKSLLKSINRRSTTDLSNQAAFKESLDELFDVAHQDAMSIINIDEDRLFLQAQREKGRKGIMFGVDRKLAQKEERVMKRKNAAVNYEKKVRTTTPAETIPPSVSSVTDSSDDGNIKDVVHLQFYSPTSSGTMTDVINGKKNEGTFDKIFLIYSFFPINENILFSTVKPVHRFQNPLREAR